MEVKELISLLEHLPKGTFVFIYNSKGVTCEPIIRAHSNGTVTAEGIRWFNEAVLVPNG